MKLKRARVVCRWISCCLVLDLILGSILGLSQGAIGAACCGGASNVPTVLTGDDRLQLSATVGSGAVVAEANTAGGIQYRSASDDELRQSLQLDGAILISDRFQAGLSVPILRRSRSRAGVFEEAAGLGDVVGSLAYELVPQWEYSPWKPKVFVFASLTLPTGGSMYDAATLFRVDVRGRGFVTPALGVLALQTWGAFDGFVSAEVHHALARDHVTSAGTFQLIPGWGAGASAGLGWNPLGGPLRLGLSVSPFWEAGVRTAGAVNATASSQHAWTSSLQASYMFSPTLSGSLIYSDQTWLAGAQNAALTRSVVVRIQKRWER